MMKTGIARTAALAFAVLLAACAVVQLPPNPADQDPTAGTIVFYRPMSGFGYGVRPEVFVDGLLVGKSTPGEQFSTRAKPGPHVVTVPGYGPFGKERRIDVVVRSGAKTYVRTSMGGAAFAGMTDVEAVSADAAAVELVDLDKVKR